MTSEQAGRLIAVVGPSGVGKDSLISGLTAARPDLKPVRRTITRPEEMGGEPFEGVSVAEFEERRDAGAFCLSWGAHGLFYGVPASALTAVERGEDHIVNLSRGILLEADRLFPMLIVLHVTASVEVLAARLAERGRETASDIAARLSRKTAALPPGLDLHEIRNEGTLDEAVSQALSVLEGVRA